MSQTQQTTLEQQRVKESLDKLTAFFSNTENVPKFIARSYLKSYGKPSDNWSLNNQFIMLAYGFDDARTFNKWKSVERFVKKGEHGFYIIAPNMVSYKTINAKGEEETRRYMKGFITCPYAMFGLEQTNGKAVKYVEEPKQLPPLYEVAQKMGITVVYDRTMRGESGSYDQKKDEIRLCTEEVGTFFHELTHAVHKRIDGQLKNGQDKDQEIIAEMTSAALCEIYGYDTKNYSYHYIREYSEGHSAECILRVIGKVQKILDYIFEVKRE